MKTLLAHLAAMATEQASFNKNLELCLGVSRHKCF